MRAINEEAVRSSMHRRIRRAAEPLRNDLQRTVRSLPIRSTGAAGRGGPSPTTRPLRATIAAAIRLSVRTTGNPGARVWIDRAALPPDLRGMPKVMNTGRIRHPVYGNRRRWATQTTTPLWWEQTIRRHRPRMEREVERILGDIRRRID
ncbi:hypothetical protein AVW11_04055 [Streptomyces amritsarensis]|uniref:HK97 gp10 family phage protein n=2 Tax=Streptomyces amritsarensis TaxID=681158 RepID=A0ABX3G8Y5_9ACTN|nr:hypothetical protein AVW11_04055 [Streptomyces amritsarensis]